ncbi:MAG: hypothetical protein NWE80_01480, partial [Candidatus Bathyarchaeota archaeon]|nr:hypothetical protein [Candidatus Bathyarchaeota archaeon]
MKLIMENWRGYIEEQSSADDFGTNMALIINESEESNQALASVASGVEKAEKETIRAFGDTPEAQRKIMEALEIYLGPAETWFDPKTGKWNEKPLRRMIALEKDLGKTSKAIRRAVQSDMPIEQKMAGLATATKTTAAGSLLTGLYQAWEGREAMLPSFGV